MIRYRVCSAPVYLFMALNITAVEWFHTPLDPPIPGTIRRQDSRIEYIPDPEPIRSKHKRTYEGSETRLEEDVEMPPHKPGWFIWLFGCFHRDND